MRRIEIVDAQSQAVLAVVMFDGHEVAIDTEHEGLRAALRNGVVDSAGTGLVRPADGAVFMNAVLVSYSGAYVYAVER